MTVTPGKQRTRLFGAARENCQRFMDTLFISDSSTASPVCQTHASPAINSLSDVSSLPNERHQKSAALVRWTLFVASSLHLGRVISPSCSRYTDPVYDLSRPGTDGVTRVNGWVLYLSRAVDAGTAHNREARQRITSASANAKSVHDAGPARNR